MLIVPYVRESLDLILWIIRLKAPLIPSFGDLEIPDIVHVAIIITRLILLLGTIDNLQSWSDGLAEKRHWITDHIVWFRSSVRHVNIAIVIDSAIIFLVLGGVIVLVAYDDLTKSVMCLLQSIGYASKLILFEEI